MRRALVLPALLLTCVPLPSIAQSALTPLELMRSAATHARAHGAKYEPVLSPMDGDASGVTARDIAAVHGAGFPVVVWTVNDSARQQELLDAGVDGIISDRPDLLRSLVLRNRTARGGLLGSGGLLRTQKFDAQGHRGGRDLRPESTFPAFEVALDNLVTTLETDVAVTQDRVPILSHERNVNRQTCRDADGSASGDIFIKDITSSELRRRFICDKLIRGPEQSNDVRLSPVARAFAEARHLPSPFVHPHLQELFEFVRFYEAYYSRKAGKGAQAARQRAANARRVRFNLETKIDPQYPAETVSPEEFVEVLAGTITRNHFEHRCDIQSFDFRTLVLAQKNYPSIRTVYLVGSPAQLRMENLPPDLRPAK